jgi:hypothetical protein
VFANTLTNSLSIVSSCSHLNLMSMHCLRKNRPLWLYNDPAEGIKSVQGLATGSLRSVPHGDCLTSPGSRKTTYTSSRFLAVDQPIRDGRVGVVIGLLMVDLRFHVDDLRFLGVDLRLSAHVVPQALPD